MKTEIELLNDLVQIYVYKLERDIKNLWGTQCLPSVMIPDNLWSDKAFQNRFRSEVMEAGYEIDAAMRTAPSIHNAEIGEYRIKIVNLA